MAAISIPEVTDDAECEYHGGIVVSEREGDLKGAGG